MILDFGYFTPFSFYYTEVSEMVLEVRKAGKVGTRWSARSIIFCICEWSVHTESEGAFISQVSEQEGTYHTDLQ